MRGEALLLLSGAVHPTRGVVHGVDHQEEHFAQASGENVFVRRPARQFAEENTQCKEGYITQGQDLHVEGDRR